MKQNIAYSKAILLGAYLVIMLFKLSKSPVRLNRIVHVNSKEGIPYQQFEFWTKNFV